MQLAALRARLDERSRRVDRLEEELRARTEALETLRGRLAVLRTSRERLTAKLGAEHMLAERFSRLRTDLNAALEAYLAAASSMEDYGMEVAQSLVDLDSGDSVPEALDDTPAPSLQPEPSPEPPTLPQDQGAERQ